MKHPGISLDRERLEVIYSKSEHKQVKESKFFSTLKKIWLLLFTALTDSNELQVWQTSDSGKTCWNAYDPATGRSLSLASENELRVWIEERYYQ